LTAVFAAPFFLFFEDIFFGFDVLGWRGSLLTALWQLHAPKVRGASFAGFKYCSAIWGQIFSASCL
jgi:hypothetical protein